MCASIIDKYLNRQNIYEYLSFGEFASYYNMKDNKLSKCRKQKTIRFVNYNKQKIIENWSREQLLLYSPFKNSENSLLGTHVTWDDAYCGIYIYIYSELDQNSIITSKPNIQMKNMTLQIYTWTFHIYKIYGMMTLMMTLVTRVL